MPAVPPLAVESPTSRWGFHTVPITSLSKQSGIASIHFGQHLSVDSPKRKIYVDPATGRIDSDIYRLITSAPKTELHVHQGGSTSVEFMIYSYRRAIMEGTILQYLGTNKSLPIYHDNGQVEQVSLVDEQGQLLPPDQLRKVAERVLTRENMREYLRVDSINETHRSLIPSWELAETTAHKNPQSTSFDEAYINKIKNVALDKYLFTTGKMNPFNRNPSSAYLVANMYAKEVAEEGVRYAEYRVSTTGNGFGGNNGVNIDETLSAVSAGFEDAKSSMAQRLRNFDYGLIVLLERRNLRPSDPPELKVERAKRVAEEVVRLKKENKYNIVGIDLAGDEANYPVNEFAEAFDIIKKYNASVPPEKRLGITVHAGETAYSRNPEKNIHLEGWQSVEQALKLAHDAHTPMRIGHGLQLINSTPILQQAFETYLAHPDDWEKRVDVKKLYDQSPLLRYIRDNNILLEMCPKSNLQTYGVHPGFANAPNNTVGDKYTARSYSLHPAVFLSRLGVKVSLSADNRTISNTDTANEAVKLYKYAGLTYQDFKKMALNGFEAAFLPASEKASILKDARHRFRALEHDPTMIRAIQKMDGKISLHQQWLLLREQIADTVFELSKKLRGWFYPNHQTASWAE